jgi:hypothetical protein
MIPINPSDLETVMKAMGSLVAPFILKAIYKRIFSKNRIYICIPDHGVNQHTLAPSAERTQIVTIRCPHDITIEKDDFRKLISIIFDSECKINSASIGDKSGDNISPLVDLKENKITIDSFRFRQGDWFNIVVKHNNILRPMEVNGEVNKILLSVKTPLSSYREESRNILIAFCVFLVLHLIGSIWLPILIYFSLPGLFLVYLWLWLIAKKPSSHWGKLR